MELRWSIACVRAIADFVAISRGRSTVMFARMSGSTRVIEPVGSSSSSCFTHRQTQAGQKQLAIGGVAQLCGARHQVRSDAAQPCDGRARFVEPADVGVACRENAV